jgi:hypothetical protein
MIELNLNKKELKLLDSALVGLGHNIYPIKWSFPVGSNTNCELEALDDRVSKLRNKLKKQRGF